LSERQTFVINFVDNLEKLTLLFHRYFVGNVCSEGTNVTDKVRKRARLEKEAKLLFLTKG
jgi:hypothetical protein